MKIGLNFYTTFEQIITGFRKVCHLCPTIRENGERNSIFDFLYHTKNIPVRIGTVFKTPMVEQICNHPT
jgi:hypothetical protein